MHYFPDLVLLTLAGFLVVALRRNAGPLFLVVWPAALIMSLWMVHGQSDRYYVPIVPSMALLSSLILVKVFPPSHRRRWVRSMPFAVVGLMCLGQMIPLYSSVQFSRRINSSYLAATDFLNIHLEPGETAFAVAEAALLIHNPVICPGLGYAKVVWGKQAQAELVNSIQRYALWYSPKTNYLSSRMVKFPFIQEFAVAGEFDLLNVWEQTPEAKDSKLPR